MRVPTRRNARRLALGAAAATSLMVATAGPAVAATAANPGVVRGGNTWLLRSSLSAGPATTAFTYGSTTDTIHVMGDWNGDGVKTPGIVRTVGAGTASHYYWYLRNSNSAGPADIAPFAYGSPGFGDSPVVGDWDGNGKDSVGVVRRQNGVTKTTWLLRNSTTAGDATLNFTYGLKTDVAVVVGDWDGDGTDTPGTVRDIAGTLTWLLSNRNYRSSAKITLTFGRAATDHPIAGDWDGNGTYGVGVLRDNAGSWSWLLRDTLSNGPAQRSFTYGRTSDAPVVWQQ